MDWLDAFSDATPESIPERALRRPSRERVPTTADELRLPKRMDGTGPLVSVVIPTYNDSHFLPEGLQSVGAQTHSNVEMIIVDSSRVSWVETLAEDREWIHYIGQDRLGLSRARNDAIEAAEGEFVALLDADDYWHPRKLETQMAALGDEKVISYTATYRVRFDDESCSVTCHDRTSGDPSNAAIDRINRRITVTPSTVVFRRTSLPNRPFNEKLDAWEDVVFYVETFRSHAPVAISEPLTVYRNHDESITADRQRMYRNMRSGTTILMEQYPDLCDPLQKMRAKSERGAGREFLENNEKRQARQHLTRSLHVTPLDYKTIVLYWAAWFPGNSARSVAAVQRLYDFLFR